MSGEWKPGDVAIARWRYFPGVPAIYTARGWIDIDNAEFDGDEDDLTLRPLVVIDPEDAEQLERLDTALDDAFRKHDPAGWERADEWADGVAVRVLTDALREFANPTPRIEEPTGLGAVVEDGEGVRWVRWTLGNWPDRAPWRTEREQPDHRRWEGVNAVRILSHGVTEDS